MRFRLLGVFFTLLVVPVCKGQISDSCKKTYVDPTTSRAVQQLEDANAKSDAGEKTRAIAAARVAFRLSLVDATILGACLGGRSENQFAGILEIRRTDKQVGATSGASGSTSLVPSGSVPALLGLAVEYGGIDETFSGTTATFRTTPAKLLGAMANAYGTNAGTSHDAVYRALQRFSLSVSFDTSRTSSATTGNDTQLLANYAQLSQATARFIVLNDRDPLAVKNWNNIRALSSSQTAQDVANSARHLVESLTEASGFDAQLDAAMAVFDANTASPDQSVLQNAMTTFVGALQTLAHNVDSWQQKIDSYIAARVALDQLHQALYKKIANAPSLSIEYDFNRPPVVQAASTTVGSTASAASPDLSTVGVVFVASSFGGNYTLTANANFFNATMPTMRGNFRDFQFGAKIDIPVGKLPTFTSKGTLTFSGLYEYLHQKPLGINLTINDQAVNQPGNIGFFQAKYTIPIGDSGLQIPISFTASNRTELVKEKDVRGNIGITFDLDKLLAKK